MECQGDRAKLDVPTKLRFHIYGYEFPIHENNIFLCTMYTL